MTRIDRSKLLIRKKGFRFQPFRPKSRHEIPLRSVDLPPEAELLAFERCNERRVVWVPHAGYHHVIQGELAGEPYLVTF